MSTSTMRKYVSMGLGALLLAGSTLMGASQEALAVDWQYKDRAGMSKIETPNKTILSASEQNQIKAAYASHLKNVPSNRLDGYLDALYAAHEADKLVEKNKASVMQGNMPYADFHAVWAQQTAINVTWIGQRTSSTGDVYGSYSPAVQKVRSQNGVTYEKDVLDILHKNFGNFDKVPVAERNGVNTAYEAAAFLDRALADMKSSVKKPHFDEFTVKAMQLMNSSAMGVVVPYDVNSNDPASTNLLKNRANLDDKTSSAIQSFTVDVDRAFKAKYINKTTTPPTATPNPPATDSVSALQAELNALKSQNNALQGNINSKKQERSSLESTVKAKEQEKLQLEAKLKQQEEAKKNNNLNDQNQAKLINQLKQDISKEKAKQTSLQNELSSENTLINRLQNTLQKLKDAITNLLNSLVS